MWSSSKEAMLWAWPNKDLPSVHSLFSFFPWYQDSLGPGGSWRCGGEKTNKGVVLNFFSLATSWQRAWDVGCSAGKNRGKDSAHESWCVCFRRLFYIVYQLHICSDLRNTATYFLQMSILGVLFYFLLLDRHNDKVRISILFILLNFLGYFSETFEHFRKF